MDTRATERHLVVEFNCGAGDETRVRDLLSEFIDPARQEDGCLYYDLYQSADTPTKFFILDGWRDQAAVEAHGRHPNVARVVKDLVPLLVEPVAIKTNLRVSQAA